MVFRPPPQPPVIAGAGKPAQSASRWSGTGIWLLLGFIVLIGLFPHAISTLWAPSSISVYGTQPGQEPVKVRRELPPPPLEVRRALPAVPRAPPASSPVSRVSNAQWQPVRLSDGTTVQVFYQGELPRSASLPSHGRVHRRGVVDRQHKLDLDEVGWSEFCFLDRSGSPSLHIVLATSEAHSSSRR
jgi:hypothetical protein